MITIKRICLLQVSYIILHSPKFFFFCIRAGFKRRELHKLCPIDAPSVIFSASLITFYTLHRQSPERDEPDFWSCAHISFILFYSVQRFITLLFIIFIFTPYHYNYFHIECFARLFNVMCCECNFVKQIKILYEELISKSNNKAPIHGD